MCIARRRRTVAFHVSSHYALFIRSRHMALYECVLIDGLIDANQWLKYKFGGGGTVILAWAPSWQFWALVDGRGPLVADIGI